MLIFWLSGYFRDGGTFGASVLVFEDWVIIGSPDYDNYKDRAYLYIKESGSCKQQLAIGESDEIDGNVLVKMWQFLGKPWFLG